MNGDALLDLELPRGIGEIISDAVQTLAKNVLATLIVMLPFCAIELIVREAGSSLAANTRVTATRLAEGDLSLQALQDVVVQLGFAITFFVGSMVIIVVLVTTATVQAQAVMQGEHRPPGELLRRGLRLAPRVIAAEMLFDLVLVALTLLPLALAAAGWFFWDGNLFLQIGTVVVLGFLWLATTLTLYLRWALFPQVIVLENMGPIAALIRSSELMGPAGVRFRKGPKARLSVILFVYFGFTLVVQSTFLLPLGILGFMEGIPLEEMPPPLASVPLWLAIPVAIVQVINNSILYPLKAYLPTLFYYDLQARYGQAPSDVDDEVKVDGEDDLKLSRNPNRAATADNNVSLERPS